jgi:integrase
MNRKADHPYPYERINARLSEFASRLDIRDSTGRLVDFNRTHRFRHTKATSLLNSIVKLTLIMIFFAEANTQCQPVRRT